jgi:hypothetical protein
LQELEVEVKRREQGDCGGGGPQHHVPLVLLPGEDDKWKKEGSMAKRYADLGWAALAGRKKEGGGPPDGGKKDGPERG